MQRRPGTPSLLRELNDRSALELLLAGGPMTRAQLGEHTGLSKVTASQALARLERARPGRGGGRAGWRPRSERRAVRRVPSSAYVAGLHVERDEISAGVADVTGNVVAKISVNPATADDPVALVRGAVMAACDSAGVAPESLRAFVIGTPGVLDPRTGDPRLAVNLPAWHEGVLDALRSDLGRPVTLENDVNLAAMAERSVGAAAGVSDFVLVWIGVGLGLATVLGGRAAPGRGRGGRRDRLPAGARRPAAGGRHAPGDRRVPAAGRRAGAAAARRSVRVQPSPPPPPPSRLPCRAADAGEERGGAFLGELAGRVATGVAAISVVLDPGLVVLGGDVGLAGGTALAERVASEVGRICPARPTVVPSAVSGGPVLRGAILAAVDQARSELLDSVAAPA